MKPMYCLSLAASWTVSVVGASPPAAGQCDQFQLVPTVYPAVNEPSALAIGDLDGDGESDLAVADASGSELGVMLGRKDASFGEVTIYPAGAHPLAVALGDIDGDGDVDAVVANQGWYDHGAQLWRDYGLTLLFNSGAGRFASHVFVPMPTGKLEPQGVALGDIDADGDLDVTLAIGNSGYLLSDVAVLTNDGSGRLGAPAFFPTGYDPVALALADIDGDAYLDLLTANHFGYSLSVLLGVGDGTFAPAQAYPTGQYPRDVALADVDGDGDLDAAVPYRYGVRVLRNVGNGAFGWAGTYSAGIRPEAAAFADLDGDGDQDLLAVDVVGDAIYTWTNAGDGAFVPRDHFFVGNAPTDLTARDLDRDGDPEVAVVNAYDGNVAVLRNECPISTYCVGKQNSQGCIPEIGWSGTPSASGADDFFVMALSELNNRTGIVFFGLGTANTPFEGGTLCVQAPFVRTPVQDSGGNPGADDCSGSYVFHASQAWMNQHRWWASEEIFAQYWSRDPAHPDGTGVALSNALRFTIQP